MFRNNMKIQKYVNMYYTHVVQPVNEKRAWCWKCMWLLLEYYLNFIPFTACDHDGLALAFGSRLHHDVISNYDNAYVL